MISIITVDDLPPGGFGIVKQINADDTIKQRLMDMGIFEGVKVQMVRPAPLGDPIQVKVLNTLIALRRNEARSLIIETSGVIHHGHKAHRRRFGRKSKQWKNKPL